MWFKYPHGAAGISIERMSFGVEATDEHGGKYFRAPDHFAPKILALNGFVLVEEPPANAPADLPKNDPERDNAIMALTKSMSALQIEIQNLKSDNNAMAARVNATQNENNDLRKDLADARALAQQLQEELDDRPAAAVAVPAAKAK